MIRNFTRLRKKIETKKVTHVILCHMLWILSGTMAENDRRFLMLKRDFRGITGSC